MDILVKEGMLFLQGVKFGKKIWRKILVMVFKPSQVGIGRIEMHDMREGAGTSAKLAILKKAEKRVIRLTECLSVTPAPSESCPAGCAAFYLNTVQRIYTLAAPVQDEWVPVLCSLAFQGNEGGGEAMRAQGRGGVIDASMTDNSIYASLCPGQFHVTVTSTEASSRCCMSGSYLLSPEKESLCLLNMKTGHVVFCWPYRFLRRFGLVKDGISIEAGRRCETGDGLFIFLSKQGPQIFQAIEEAIMHQSVQDLLSQAMAQPQVSTVQPPVQRVSPASPNIDISRRNRALPALPAPSPPVSSPQPEIIYAKVKPLPKPRNILTPPALSEPKRVTEPKTETNPNRNTDLKISDSESDSYEWNQKAKSREDSSESHLYSTITPIQYRRNPDIDTKQELPKSIQQSPVFAPVSFKQILSNVLFKDITRNVPSPQPQSHRETSDLLAESDYCEIQK